MMLSVPNLFAELHKPIFGSESIFRQDRSEMYFIYGSFYKVSVIEAVNRIKSSHTKDIGMIVEHGAWEYPFFALLGKSYRLEHVAVNNPSAFTTNSKRMSSFAPGFILHVKAAGSPDSKDIPTCQSSDEIIYHSCSYRRCWSSQSVDMYKKVAGKCMTAAISRQLC
jgi:hypothetical protein